jgi:streptomycin 6-kinase
LLKQQLLSTTSAHRVLLHADLHQGNILSHKNDWLVIDPKGAIGLPINDFWACVENPDHDLWYISERFDYPIDDVIKWYYVHLVLAACWQAEDNLDSTLFLQLADAILPKIKNKL